MAVARTLPKKQSFDKVYVQGNTVRQIQLERPEYLDRAPERQRRPQSYTIKRNQEKALQMDLPYLIALVIAACLALKICANYIQIQSEMTARMDTIQQLELELEALKSENDALETRINTYVDLDHVYKVATEDLGMVYAGKEQVLLYNKTESEYVKQYEDIPAR